MDLFDLPFNPDLVDYLKDPDNFLFGMALEKSETAKGDKLRIRGIASAEVKDADGESLIQKGMDCSPLLSTGYINWDHKEEKYGPAYLIGEPTDVEIVPASKYAEKIGKSLPGFALLVHGFIYNDPINKPIASAAWAHLNTPDVSPSRQLRWSVQGRVLERDRIDKSRIVRSECRHLAITHQPIQRYTFAEIVKSFGTREQIEAKATGKSLSTESAAPTLKENIDGRMTKYRNLLYSECSKGCYSDDMKFVKGVGGALRHLHFCQNVPLGVGQQFLKSLIEMNYDF